MGLKERKLCNKVYRLCEAEIRDVAILFRTLLASSTKFNTDKLDIAGVLDHLRDKGAIEFIILEDNELPNEYAVSVPKEKSIFVRQSVYHNACDGVPRDTFTLAHELGHLLLHADTNPTYAHSQSTSLHHYQEDAEWQANTFASELLVDSRNLKGIKNPKDLEIRFGISFETACYVYERYKKEDLL